MQSYGDARTLIKIKVLANTEHTSNQHLGLFLGSRCPCGEATAKQHSLKCVRQNSTTTTVRDDIAHCRSTQ